MITPIQKAAYRRQALERRDLNSGKPWSETDVADLYASHTYGSSINETASFLCRSFRETAAKARALGLKVRRQPTGQARRRDPKKTPRPEDRMHRWKGRMVPDQVTKKK